MSRKPVIVGVDGSPESVRAAALGWRIADAARAPCRLVHAAPDVWAAASLAQVPVYSAPLARDLTDDAQRQLEIALRDAVPRHLLENLEVRIGRAALVLRETVTAGGGAELVVLSGKHHGLLARGFGGSTAHYLIRTLDAPVLVAGPSARSVERVLAAVDLSEVAPAALAAAARFVTVRARTTSAPARRERLPPPSSSPQGFARLPHAPFTLASLAGGDYSSVGCQTV